MDASTTVASRTSKKQTVVPRERILVAAARQFRERGYRAATVRDIGKEVGILSGSLFHHFATKEQILVDMLREATISLCTGIEARLDSVTDPVQRLRVLIRFEMECFAGPQTRDYFAVLVSEWRDVPASVQPELRALRTRYAEISKSVMQACHAAGVLRVPPEAAERVLHGITTGSVSWFKNNGRYTVSEFADIIVSLLLKEGAALGAD